MIGPDTLEYTNLYVQPAVNRVGHSFASLALLGAGIRRMIAILGAQSRGQYWVSAGNRGFLRFIDRHMTPYVVSKVEMKLSIKRLGPDL